MRAVCVRTIEPVVAKTLKNTRDQALSISNEWNPPEVDDGRTTTTGERREWLKEKRKESEREGRRLKDLIRLEELRMMNRALAMHTSPNTTALPRADETTDDVRDRINDLERMHNLEADNGNDHSDDATSRNQTTSRVNRQCESASCPVRFSNSN